MSRTVSAEVRPLNPNKQQARSESAQEIHGRLLKSTTAARTMWVHQAQAILDMRACKGWKDLGYESQEEWLTQPEIDLTPSTARKLARVLTVFVEAGIEPDEIAEVSPYQLAVTTRAVAAGEVEPERAIADAKSMHKSELEVRYAEDLDAALDADGEPEKWSCPTCRKVHARIPAFLREEETEATETYAAGNIESAGEVF